LSEVNHERKKGNIKFINIDNTLFITVGGIPPMKTEFIDLKFPGKVMNYWPPFFDREDQINNKKTVKETNSD